MMQLDDEPCPSTLKHPAPAHNKPASKRSRGEVAAGKGASKPASKRSRGEVAAGKGASKPASKRSRGEVAEGGAVGW
jgi:hypothetical protein